MTVSGEERSRDLTLVDAYEGEEILFEAVCTPTFGRDRQPLGVVSVLRDVTDLRRADQELRANYDKLRQAEEAVRQDRDRLNLVIENVGDPILVCDNAARFVLLDPLARDLFGSESDSLRDELRVKNHARFAAYISTFTFGFELRASTQVIPAPRPNPNTMFAPKKSLMNADLSPIPLQFCVISLPCAASSSSKPSSA